MRLLLALLSIVLATLVHADVTVNIPVRSQLPQIAHFDAPYNWTISANTFGYVSNSGPSSPASTPALTYTASGLPSWVQFDAATLTFSGNPVAGSSGADRVTVTASLTDPAQANGGTTSASSSFQLLLLSDPFPTIKIPIEQQLASGSSSLGPKNILPHNTLHVPSGWSFSLGFDGGTFSLSNGNSVFMALTANGSTTMPSWMTYSADTFTLYGVAPTTGEYLYDFSLIGSNRRGFGGVQDTFRVLVSAEALSIAGGLRSANVTVGNKLTYQIPTTGLELNGQQNNAATNPVTVSANIDAIKWLTYDSSTSTLTGTPSFDDYGNSSTRTLVPVPVSYTDSKGNKLTVNLTVNVMPSAFTALTLPNVILAPGATVSVSLAPYIRNVSSLAARQVSSAATRQSINASYTPANASEFLLYDGETEMLTGTMPASKGTKVKVDLQTTNTDNEVSSASFWIANSAADVPSSTNGGKTSNASGNGGLSHKAKIALAAALGGVGGLLLLIALMICCRRYVAKEAHDFRGAVYGEGDEHTLTDKESTRPHYKKALVIRTAGEAMTPSTMAASPYGDFEKQLEPVSPYSIRSVTIEEPNGRRTTSSDEPTQTQMINNLFHGKKGKRKSVPPINAGLGLEGVDDGPYEPTAQIQSGVDKSQSQKTMGTHRSSWESDLFYEDAAETNKGPTLTVTDTSDDVPRRRGGGLTVRQRTTHNGQSPNFQAVQSFVPSEKAGKQEDPFHDSRTGLTPTGQDDEARIMEARVMQVRRHSPMMHTNNNPFSQAQPRAATAEEKRQSEAFDDAAEDFEGADVMGTGLALSNNNRRPVAQDRSSVMSTMTDSSQMQALRTHYANEDAAAAAASSSRQQQGVKSPNPSFMDGASISGFEPQETMRAIPPRPRTPPAYSSRSNSPTKAAASAAMAGGQSSMGSSRFLPCPNVAAIVNYPLRFHIFPSVPPPMAGAPGSPGKRSGDAMRYSLVVDDAQPHLAPYRLTWPDMLGDWLTFNDATFEAFGIVPDEAGLEELGDVEIALIMTRKAGSSKVQPSPTAAGRSDSPTKTSRHNKRGSTVSIDSSNAVITEEDVTIVARARLCFQAEPQAI